MLLRLIEFCFVMNAGMGSSCDGEDDKRDSITSQNDVDASLFQIDLLIFPLYCSIISSNAFAGARHKNHRVEPARKIKWIEFRGLFCARLQLGNHFFVSPRKDNNNRCNYLSSEKNSLCFFAFDFEDKFAFVSIAIYGNDVEKELQERFQASRMEK